MKMGNGNLVKIAADVGVDKNCLVVGPEVSAVHSASHKSLMNLPMMVLV